MHPAVFVERLAESGAPFRKGKAGSGFPVDAHCYAEILTSMMSSAANRHAWAGSKAPVGSFSLTSEKLTKQFGRGGFKRINEHLGLIEVGTSYCVEKKVTRAFWITPKGREFIKACQQSTADGYVGTLWDVHPADRKGRKGSRKGYTVRRLHKRSNGIASLDNKGRARIGKGWIRWSVPINMETTWAALQTGLDALFPRTDPKRLHSMETQLALVHLCASNNISGAGWGLLPQTYEEDKSGRLNSLGGISIQNIHKELRGIVMAGSHEYDMDNCHWRILQQLSGVSCPAIDRYVDDHRAIRQHLANDLGITYVQAKEALLSLLFGVTQGTNTHFNSLPRTLGRSTADRLYKHPDWIDLRSEVKRARTAMAQQSVLYQGGGYKAGMRINIRGKGWKVEGVKLLSHQLQGWESELLHCVISEYGQHIILLQHDGWGLDVYVDPADIRGMLKHRTGLDMPISYTALASNPLAP